MNCIYREEELSNGLFGCQIHNRCHLTEETNSNACCETCENRLVPESPEFVAKWHDPLLVLNRRKVPTDSLRGFLGGASVFLIGGGPSSNDLPLEELNTRGIWSMGVNNVAGHPRFKANSFVCSDPPLKFSHSIWLDPGIMKFVPIPKMSRSRAKLKIKKNGEFSKLKETVTDAPNVWGFKRNSWLSPDDGFFTSPGACWGNLKAGVLKTGEEKTVCTLFLGLRILRYLGAKQIFLIGVDHRMVPGNVYSFDQGKSDGGCNSNNRQFRIVNDLFCRMQERGSFERFGLEVFNCYERSGLRAFPHVPFEQALEICRDKVERIPDLAEWYDKK